MHWITENVLLLRQCGAFDPVFALLRSSCQWMETDEYPRRILFNFSSQEHSELKLQSVLEVKCSCTILYMMLVIDSDESFKETICTALLNFISEFSLFRSSIHPLAHPYTIPDEIHRSCRPGSTLPKTSKPHPVLPLQSHPLVNPPPPQISPPPLRRHRRNPPTRKATRPHHSQPPTPR